MLCKVMIWKIIFVHSFIIENIFAVRLHKLFQFIDGFKSEHDLKGFLHVGNDYAVLLQKPKPHDKDLVYELYEIKHSGDINTDKPPLLAISKVPVKYIREQLKMFLYELYRAKYEDNSVVPGTNVISLREWQIDQSLKSNANKLIFPSKPNVLRTVL